MAPPRPLLRFDAVRQLDTFDTTSDEEQFARGRYFPADCAASDAVGDFIHITGDKVAGVYQVTKVDILDAATMPCIGVITSKASSLSCFVMTFGVVPATGLVAGKRYWVGSDSKLSDSFPTPGAGDIAVAQVVGVALDSTELLLRPELQAHKLRG